MNVEKNFILQEFLPEETYKNYRYQSTRFINPVLFKIAQGVRNFFKAPVVINTWHTKSTRKYNYRGYRPPDCSVGAPESAHKRGMAIDFTVKGYTPEQVQQAIKDNYHTYFKALGITAIEADTKTWTHASCENWNQEELKIIGYWRKAENE